MLDEFGYASLCDYGMSKILKEGELTNSFCGSPEYLSPEMIIGNGHNAGTDWWSLGILLYEMLFSIPPFYQKNQNMMYQAILYANLKYPKTSDITDECRDFLERLLDKRKDLRLGAKGGLEEVKAHPWLKGTDWEAIMRKQVKPPFIPPTTGKSWVANFDPAYTSKNPNNTKESYDSELIQEFNDLFKDFSFVKSYQCQKVTSCPAKITE